MIDQLGGPSADPVDLDVIRMPVGAVPVVDREHVGGFLPEHARDPLPCFVELGLVERSGVLVPVPAAHAGVLVSEPDDSVDTEHRCRRIGFGAAPIGERLALGQVVRDFTVFAVRGDDQHDPMPLGGSTCHRAPGRDALVVGVCVQTDQGSHRRECASSRSKT